MFKSICDRIEKKLLMNDFSKYPFFDKKVKHLILKLINDLYPPINNRKSIVTIFRNNFTMMKIFSIPIFLILFGWTVADKLNQTEIESLVEKNKSIISVANHFYDLKETHREDLNFTKAQVDSLLDYFEFREWKEFIIFKEASIKIPKYLPDSVFFMMENARMKNNIPNFIYWRLINKESTFRMIENTSSGAFGYMQVMPGTFTEFKEELKLIGGHTVRNNIEVGSYLLAKHYCTFIKNDYDERKSWELALSSYNAGYGNVLKAGYNIPNFKETKDYVKYILKNFKEA